MTQGMGLHSQPWTDLCMSRQASSQSPGQCRCLESTRQRGLLRPPQTPLAKGHAAGDHGS